MLEGWRSISQSYAVINQWLLLTMARRPELRLSVRDLPYANPDWARAKALFTPDDEQTLSSLPLAAAGEHGDATLRMTAPYDFTLSPQGRTVVFGTSEFRIVPPFYLAGQPDIARLAQEPSFFVWAPSRWSADGFLRLGLRQEQVAMIPLGIDPATFRPTPEGRDAVRRNMGLRGFTFLSVGAMTGSKGIDVLMQAFAAVASQRSDVTLFLKGADGLYQSAHLLDEAFQKLSPGDRQLVADRLVYNGEGLSMKQMAALYRSADAYVSPYRGEGFNMPVLEAVACGVPVICTGGGTTDDFVTDDFALKIQSRIAPMMLGGMVGDQLVPDRDHLVAQMLAAMDREGWRRQASVAGPAHAALHYSWDTIATRLQDVLFA
ncbi:MAG: glycosyltransferase family 4 protein [Xanthobacteraceae bacterium]|nr:glycosyltransferase family 4 protein [Xanthobacteraceae bacterium]